MVVSNPAPLNVRVYPPANDELTNVVVAAEPNKTNAWYFGLVNKAYFPSIVY